MATTLKLRRGTTAEHSTFTGAVGEVTVDTDKDVIVVHDGSTAGGFPALRAGSGASVSSVTNSGNLTFTSTGQRILGDFSNATAANRVAFQSSTTDGETSLVVIPNGTSTTTRIQLGDASNLGGSGNFLNLFNTGSEVSIRSGTYSGGTGLPMTLYTSGTEKLRIAADATGTYTFGGTAPRITGDFSNATVANRVMFQTSTVNGLTSLDAMPNGTSQISVLNLWNSSDPINAARIQVGALSTEARLLTDKTGTGTFLPMTFYTGGSEAMRIDTSRNVGIGQGYGLTNSRLVVAGQSPGANGAYATGVGSIVLNESGRTALSNNGGLEFKASVFGSGYGAKIIALDAGELVFGNRSNSATWIERMRIDSSGNVGIGTSSPGNRLTLPNNNYIGWKNSSNTGETAGIIVNSSNNLILYNTGDRVAVDASGYTQFLGNNVMPYQGAPTSKAAAATLTGAELVTGILNTTGTTYTITLPTGTNIEGALTWAGNNVCLDWFVINTASGTITIGANGNTTLGALTIATGTSAHFRIRRTAANTFTVYRL